MILFFYSIGYSSQAAAAAALNTLSHKYILISIMLHLMTIPAHVDFSYTDEIILSDACIYFIAIEPV